MVTTLFFFHQRDCIQFALTAKPAQRYMPTDHKSLQYKIWILVMSKPFDTFILVLIALNTGVLMTQVGEKKVKSHISHRTPTRPQLNPVSVA